MMCHKGKKVKKKAFSAKDKQKMIKKNKEKD